jgi:hypothetical protein
MAGMRAGDGVCATDGVQEYHTDGGHYLSWGRMLMAVTTCW